MKRKKALGRGLEALLPSVKEESGSEKGLPAEVDIQLIDPNPFQPRIDWDDSELESLANSIKQQGLLQPVIVRKVGSRYQLIAGERRLRASKIAKLKLMPVFVRDATEKEMMALALIENIQRQDLNPMEKAEAFNRFCSEFELTQEELGQQVGISRSAVANFQRLIELPDSVKEMVRSGKLSMGHGRALLSLKHKQSMVRVAQLSCSRGLSVRALEEYVKKSLSPKKKAKTRDILPEVKQLEVELERVLGTKVKLKDFGGSGKLEIEYASLDELDRVLSIIRRPKKSV